METYIFGIGCRVNTGGKKNTCVPLTTGAADIAVVDLISRQDTLGKKNTRVPLPIGFANIAVDQNGYLDLISRIESPSLSMVYIPLKFYTAEKQAIQPNTISYVISELFKKKKDGDEFEIYTSSDGIEKFFSEFKSDCVNAKLLSPTLIEFEYNGERIVSQDCYADRLEFWHSIMFRLVVNPPSCKRI